MLLKGKAIISYTIKTFLDAYPDLIVILVLPEDYIDTAKGMDDIYFDKNRIKIIAGGKTRFHSVKNGLALIKEKSIIFVHDGVRCLLTQKLIHRCFDNAQAFGSAIPVIPSKDSVRLQNGKDNEPIDRNKVMLVQTPQTFKSEILLPAFEAAYNDSFTDEATVVEASGKKVFLVEGEDENIKITMPVDLLVAEKILENQK
jgi:2-C-methyl-D-erythritol 4-phosphate cytidylyltransferase